MTRFVPPGSGWHRDLADYRDFSPSHSAVALMLKGIACKAATPSPRSAMTTTTRSVALPPDVSFARLVNWG